MLGGLSVIVGTVVGVVSLIIAGVFGGPGEEIVHETVQAGETVSVTIQEQEADTEPRVTVERSHEEPQEKPDPSIGVSAVKESESPDPTPEVKAASDAVELDEECVSGEDLDVSADGQNIRVRVEGAEAEVCASGDEDGTAHVETNVESDNAQVHLKQNVNSSSSVKSTTRVNVSTD
jgi:hypothetical protein